MTSIIKWWFLETLCDRSDSLVKILIHEPPKMDLTFCRASTADDTDVHVFYRNLFVFKMFCWLITPFSLVISSPVCCQGRADIFLIRKSPRIAWTCSLIVVPTNLTLIKEACGRLLTLQRYFWGMNELRINEMWLANLRNLDFTMEKNEEFSIRIFSQT